LDARGTPQRTSFVPSQPVWSPGGTRPGLLNGSRASVSNCRRALRWSVLPRARSRLLQCCERILDPLNRVREK
jgi:hypothetical protein